MASEKELVAAVAVGHQWNQEAWVNFVSHELDQLTVAVPIRNCLSTLNLQLLVLTGLWKGRQRQLGSLGCVA